jgi:hypothetical protein
MRPTRVLPLEMRSHVRRPGWLPARLVAVATGAVILALALWTLATDKEYGGWLLRNGRTAH